MTSREIEVECRFLGEAESLTTVGDTLVFSISAEESAKYARMSFWALGVQSMECLFEGFGIQQFAEQLRQLYVEERGSASLMDDDAMAQVRVQITDATQGLPVMGAIWRTRRRWSEGKPIPNSDPCVFGECDNAGAVAAFQGMQLSLDAVLILSSELMAFVDESGMSTTPAGMSDSEGTGPGQP